MWHSVITPLWLGFIQMIFFSDNKGCSEHPNIYIFSQWMQWAPWCLQVFTKDAVSTLISTCSYKRCSEHPNIYCSYKGCSKHPDTYRFSQRMQREPWYLYISVCLLAAAQWSLITDFCFLSSLQPLNFSRYMLHGVKSTSPSIPMAMRLCSNQGDLAASGVGP